MGGLRGSQPDFEASSAFLSMTRGRLIHISEWHFLTCTLTLVSESPCRGLWRGSVRKGWAALEPGTG